MQQDHDLIRGEGIIFRVDNSTGQPLGVAVSNLQENCGMC